MSLFFDRRRFLASSSGLAAMFATPFFGKTVRWNDGVDAERYEAVEAREDGLVWYAWSHVQGQGRHDECAQSYADFLREGPLRPMPPQARAELEAFVRARVLGSSS